MPLKTLSDWMNLLTSEDRRYQQDDLSINIYGEGDDAYLVFEQTLSHSPRVVNQYTFHAEEGVNKLHALIVFLHSCDFSLSNLADKITQVDYLEDGMNDIARIDGMEIARYAIEEN